MSTLSFIEWLNLSAQWPRLLGMRVTCTERVITMPASKVQGPAGRQGPPSGQSRTDAAAR